MNMFVVALLILLALVFIGIISLFSDAAVKNPDGSNSKVRYVIFKIPSIIMAIFASIVGIITIYGLDSSQHFEGSVFALGLSLIIYVAAFIWAVVGFIVRKLLRR